MSLKRTVKGRRRVVLHATEAYCYWEEVGNVVLRTVFGNGQKLRYRVNNFPESGVLLAHESGVLTPPSVLSDESGMQLSNALSISTH